MANERAKAFVAFSLGLVQSFIAAAGILRDHPARITAADLNSSTAQPFNSSTLRIHFLTPTRIKSDGSVRAELTFQGLIRALLRRLSSLSYFHCGSELTLDFKGLIEQAAAVRTADSKLF